MLKRLNALREVIWHWQLKSKNSVNPPMKTKNNKKLRLLPERYIARSGPASLASCTRLSMHPIMHIVNRVAGC